MTNCAVTVIIPCYNSSRFLRETIDSVLQQSHAGISIVAIDDGSTDNTREILDSYGARVSVHTHPGYRNHGVAASLNLGLTLAATELVAFLDHDDVWYPDKVKAQVEIFEQDADVDLVYCNGHVIDETGRKKHKILGAEHCETNLAETLLLDCYIKSCSMVMVRRRVVGKVGLFNESLLPTDHDMWLRLQEVSKLHYVSDCLIGYRQHQTQSSHRRKLWEDGFSILRDAIKRYPYSRTSKKKRLAVLHYRLAEHDAKKGKYLNSAWNLLISFCFDPVRSCRYLSQSVKAKF
jgi:glycosyltransferase involved in cell wall biosynthesis